MRRFTRAALDEAIEVLLCTADDASTGNDGVSSRTRAACELENASLHAVWGATDYRLDLGTDHLEAAALLLDGWLPGDPVEVRS